MKVETKSDSVYFSVKGQIVIPRHLRKEFDIEEGTQAHVQATPEGILIKPVTHKFISSLRGKYKHLPLMETLQDIKQAEKAH